MLAVMCRWSSTNPNTVPSRLVPLDGVPLASTCASGNGLQPVAGFSRNAVLGVLARETVNPPPWRETDSNCRVTTDPSANLPPPSGCAAQS